MRMRFPMLIAAMAVLVQSGLAQQPALRRSSGSRQGGDQQISRIVSPGVVLATLGTASAVGTRGMP